jgi:hypothetical protein
MVLAPLICLCVVFMILFNACVWLVLENVFEVVFDGACTTHVLMRFFILVFQCLCCYILGNAL